MSNRYEFDGSEVHVVLDTSTDIAVNGPAYNDEEWTINAGGPFIFLDGIAVAERLLLGLAAVVCPVSMGVSEELQRIASEALTDPDMDAMSARITAGLEQS